MMRVASIYENGHLRSLKLGDWLFSYILGEPVRIEHTPCVQELVDKGIVHLLSDIFYNSNELCPHCGKEVPKATLALGKIQKIGAHA